MSFSSKSALTRRRFVTSLAATGALTQTRSAHALTTGQTLLPGAIPPIAQTHYDLTVGRTAMTIAGKSLNAPCIDASVPGPILRWREGDDITLNVTNNLRVPTSIHWHGIRLPAPMDGVPGISFHGIPAGETFTYRFPVKQSGTYWYHGHSSMQEAIGLYGALVIDPIAPDPNACARDYVILLSEWSDVAPHDIVSNLKMQGDYYNFRQRSLASLFGEARQDGLGPALHDRLRWSRMNMSATDISDVTGTIYTYLMNGQAPDQSWTGLFRPGERVRLRFINASAMTFFDIRIPGLEMHVVQADGNDIEPVPVDEFRIGVAETYDVIVRPTQDRAYAIFTQSESRTGYASGTLAPRPGMRAPIPPMDPRPVRTMVDMGMGNMHDGMKMEHARKPAPAQHDDMPDVDMGDMKMDHDDMADMPDMAMKPAAPPIQRDDPGPPPINVENQNVAMMPTDRTGSPGDGLENNGRRVLNYKQLRATRPGSDPRPPTREIVLHLTGNMERYIWGFDGKKFSEAAPIVLRRNERVRFTLFNDTMMEHPIHLHGLWSELENGQGEHRPYKHTIISQPGSKLSYLVTADAPGMWAYHCHLQYHMDLGMFRTVVVL
ncbi:copper resistance system multicopper oxidase [Kozakia baliensis]|uniref:Copper resistance protein CopA n=1 Tax=Kozakia baliensis TaxID=153496 RepID=A0A1D8UQV5_9PROT|nr:copper resistance system multicopper oxidase [Kozakia baliensis]AOX16014.1 copper resistance protein CopA [Kozakia baliensis]GBR27164.1 copper resistance protein CopA [Kozakia baliensis NRIC 0488]GEL64084.1 copper oxidase [Kozakia baliensis]